MISPILAIVAGSNGSGKSTLTSGAKSKFQDISLLDPDAIAKSLQESLSGVNSDIEAGRQVLRRAEQMIEARQSFTVETTLSGGTYLKMASRAKEAGFSIVVFFIGTDSVEINIDRVRARVKKGGHDVPEEDQRRRFPRTLANMPRLLLLADLALIFDNSTNQGHMLIGVKQAGSVRWTKPLPEWATGLRFEA